MAPPSRHTDWVCSEGHEWYSYSTVPAETCPYGRCGGVVRAVRGLLAKKKDVTKA